MYDEVGTVLYWESCKRPGFDHVNKLFEHKPGVNKENKKNKDSKG